MAKNEKRKKATKVRLFPVNDVRFQGHTLGTSPSRIPCMTARELRLIHERVDRTPKGQSYGVDAFLENTAKRKYEG